jgi:hypothetical protein
MMEWDGRRQLASRLAWLDQRGPIPVALQVCHHCDNPICIEVTHLFLGTQQDNLDDMVAKGRHYGNQKYEYEVILAIKAATGTVREIAERFGVSRSHVWNVRNGVYRPEISHGH